MNSIIKNIIFVILAVTINISHASEEEQIKAQILEDETTLLVSTCKNSLLDLYKESYEYPEQFQFDKIKLFVDNESQLSVYLKYRALRGSEIISQNFECTYQGNKSSTFSGNQNSWELVRLTTSYSY